MSFSKWKLPKYEKHRAELERRGISVKQAEQRGYEPLTAEETHRRLHQNVGPTIGMGNLKADGTRHEHQQYQLLERKPGGQRYTQSARSGALLHCRKPRSASGKAFTITEGVYKADALAEATGECAISLPGVDSYLLGGKLHPELAAIPKGSRVDFCYDTDQRDKPQVRRALLDLADRLSERKIKIRFREIYSVTTIEKTGADDFLQHYGAEAYEAAPLHDMGSPTVKGWREQLAKDSANNQLPAALRGLQPFDPDWYKTKPPAADWIFGRYLQTKETALLLGEAGAGKTTFGLYMHACIGTGTGFFDSSVSLPRRTLYIMCERSEVGLRRRWHKVAHALADALPAKDRANFVELLHDNCYLRAISGESLRLIEFRHNEWIVSPAVDAFIQELLAAGIEVIFLDPLSRLHGGNENDAAVAAMITKALERIVTLAGCSVVLVHHTGKSINGGQYSGRGSSAFNDNTSECVILTNVEYEKRSELDLTGLPTDDPRADIVLVHHARCSDGRPAEDMYLARSTATGLWLPCSIVRKSKADLEGEDVRKLLAWAADNAPVSQRQCEQNCTDIGLSRNAVRRAFGVATGTGALAKTSTKRGGGAVFTVNSECASAPPVRRRTGAPAHSVGKGA